jgi:hypothetical protein
MFHILNEEICFILLKVVTEVKNILDAFAIILNPSLTHRVSITRIVTSYLLPTALISMESIGHQSSSSADVVPCSIIKGFSHVLISLLKLKLNSMV